MCDEDYFHLDDMSPRGFLTELLPINKKTRTSRPKVSFKDVAPDTNTFPDIIYDRIRSSGLLPGYQLLRTRNAKFCADEFNLNDGGSGPLLVFSDGNDPWNGPEASWKSFEMVVHVQSSSDVDPFQQKSEAREDMENYVSAQFSRQPRLSVLSLVIFGKYARLVAWDHGRCSASTRFDFIKHPHLLAEFFWRFAHQDRIHRGYDPTVSNASSTEARLLTSAIRNFIKKSTRDASFLRSALDTQYPTYKVHVTEPSGKKHHLIVRKPLYDRGVIEGMATKVYGAYSVTEKRVVILKDCWTFESPTTLPEHEIYAGFREKSVPHVPVTLFVGPVEVDGKRQHGATDHFYNVKTPWWQQRTIQEVLYPITTARSSKELIQATRDAVEALGVAHTALNILHQDISTGNVMLTEDGRGVLNDWGVAMLDIPENTHKINYAPIGTWHFLSMNLLQKPWEANPRTIDDDLESIFWFLLWIAARHVKATSLWPFSENLVFEECWQRRYTDNGHSLPLDTQRGRLVDSGGDRKRSFLGNHLNMAELKWRCKPFDALMHDLASRLRMITMRPRADRIKAHPSAEAKTPLEKKSQELDIKFLKEFEPQRIFFSDPENLVRLFDEALAVDDWMENDIVPDMLPSTDEGWRMLGHRRFEMCDVMQGRVGKWREPPEDVTVYPPVISAGNVMPEKTFSQRKSNRKRVPSTKCIANQALEEAGQKRKRRANKSIAAPRPKKGRR